MSQIYNFITKEKVNKRNASGTSSMCTRSGVKYVNVKGKKVKLSPYLIKRYAMKMYWEVEV
jgi:hypothetical protein